MKWFRFYSDSVNDPKVQLCGDYAFKTWVCTLCIASMTDGELPDIDELCFRLRIRLDRGRKVINELIDRGLIDKTPNGLTPHNWHGRQFQSDDINARVKRSREAKRNVSCNVTEALHVTLETQTQRQTQIRGDEDFDFEVWLGKIHQAHPQKRGMLSEARINAQSVLAAAVDIASCAASISKNHPQWCEYWEEAKTEPRFIPNLCNWFVKTTQTGERVYPCLEEPPEVSEGRRPPGPPVLTAAEFDRRNLERWAREAEERKAKGGSV